MDLVCIGINHKLCPVQIREQLAFSEADLPQALVHLQQIDGVRECFLLSTCNRVEVYGRAVVDIEMSLTGFLADFHGVAKELFQPFLYRHRGREAVHHLFRVASGLDSLVVGENEIYGQVRSAFRLANRMKTLDSVLYQVVERAIRVGKRVRSETKINDRSVSVSSIAVDLAEKIFGRLTDERILVLGTGKMSDQTMKQLVASGARNITVASRTYERALEVAQRFGARPIGFDEWFRALQASDLVISSTRAPQPIVHFDDVKRIMIERRHRPLCFIDIAVPRDIDPRVAEIDDVYLYDIDDLKAVSDANLRLRKKEVQHCEAIIAREVDAFDQWYEYLQARPVVEKLNTYFDEVVEQELQKARHQFKGKEKELDVLLHKIKASFLHVPLEQLKESAQSGSTERYLETLHTLFRLEQQEDPRETTPQKGTGR